MKLFRGVSKNNSLCNRCIKNVWCFSGGIKRDQWHEMGYASIMELFCKNNQQFLALNWCVAKKHIIHACQATKQTFVWGEKNPWETCQLKNLFPSTGCSAALKY